MAQFKFILWLVYWYLQTDIFEFEWDKGNSIKSFIKHGITKDEVESVFSLKLAVPIGKQVGRTASRKERKIYANLRKEIENV